MMVAAIDWGSMIISRSVVDSLAFLVVWEGRHIWILCKKNKGALLDDNIDGLTNDTNTAAPNHRSPSSMLDEEGAQTENWTRIA
jgi:hypothetical protein